MKTTRSATVAALACALAACPDSGSSNNPPPGQTAACGNGEINGVELCDGAAFARGTACGDYGLANGQVGCTASCALDFSGCSYQDYCTANSLYGNGACDPCDALGGVRDPDCDVVCGADGACADVYDPLVDAYTCRRLGKIDPDCGTCGNRILDGNELCDGTAWNPNTFSCEAYGFFGGAVACRNDCGPDFSGCLASDCGDGVIEGLEECEGEDFRGLTCADFDAVVGSLTCDASCRIDSRGCVEPGCGNDFLEPDTEECDGTDFGDATCASRGFAGGDLGCTAECGFDDSACVAPGCENGIKEPDEDCEWFEGVPDLFGATCGSLGFVADQGAVTCDRATCSYDTSSCVEPGCGNGVVEAPAEDCEGAETRACNQLGFTSGTATCSGCKWNTSSCVGGCGNGMVEGNEDCDGANLNSQTCAGIGFSGGTLACGGSCQLDTSGCTGVQSLCGNGELDAGEVCDGTRFQANAPTACDDWDLGTGSVTCNSNCLLDFGQCSFGHLCVVYGLFANGLCEPCAKWGSVGPDPECDGCVADGQCLGYWDQLAGFKDTCLVATGARDPDCTGVCGDGVIQGYAVGEDGFIPIEPCDGAAFYNENSKQCAWYGAYTGTVTCTNDCQLDLSACQ